MIDPLMDKLRPGWRERRDAQRSWWKPIEVLLVLGLCLVSYVWFCRHLVWGLHVVFHREDAGRLAQVMAGPVQALPLIVLLVAVFPFLCLAGVVVNTIVYFIPPLRRVSEKGSDRVAGLTIRHANRQLLAVGGKAALVAAPLLVLLAAWPFHRH
ncbi:hypothetical protein [Caulobacter sp. UNC358MFTsu5.1]|uniref:hypothetical protein n=1 Tax=Caulobacter sp. UNC358MFTsu5.1 TaxID=1449049 RepID=UPI0004A70C9B|nr:hypothetical protein [Caulobacter sp. UNC358MFTsu5.1]